MNLSRRNRAKSQRQNITTFVVGMYHRWKNRNTKAHHKKYENINLTQSTPPKAKFMTDLRE